MHRALYILLIAGLGPTLAMSQPSAEEKKPEVPTEAQIAALVKQLGAKEYKARKKADAAIRKLPDAALKQIKEHLKDAKDPEVKLRLKDIVDARSGPRVTLAQLKTMIIPQIEFRSANVRDCFTFLEDATDNKCRINAENVGGAPLITFRARHISALEALKIIVEVAALEYTVADGIIEITPLIGRDAPPMADDPFAAPDPF